MRWRDERDHGREFDAFVTATAQRLYRAAFMITWDQYEAEDAVQEALIKVARLWPRVRAMEHPEAFAQRVVVNHLLKRARRRTRQREELTPFDHGVLHDPSAVAAIESVGDVDRLRRALAGLTERQRTVLVLRYWVDLPEAEVARLLGCSVGNVKSTASRAAARMAALLRLDDACVHQGHDPELCEGRSS